MATQPGDLSQRANRVLSQLSLAGGLIILILFVGFPFFWIISTSLKPTEYIITRQIHLLPPAITFEHYIQVFTFGDFGRYFINSSSLAVGTVILNALVVTPAAFAVAILKVRGAKAISRLVLSLQMLPGILLLVPLYVILQDFGLLDSRVGLILSYTTFTIPFCFLLTSSYFSTLPTEMFECAFVDGASTLTSFFRIAIPLIGPGLATTSVFAFVFSWNDFMFANTFSSSSTTRTLTVEVSRLLGVWGTEWGALTAGVTVITLPIILIFAFGHRYIVDGLTMGSVKG